MWTTRCWKVTLLCGWLAAPLAGAAELDVVPVDLPELYEDGPDALDTPRLRHAEPLSCPAVPEGRMWVADTEECGDSECIRKTTVWIGSWTIEDVELQVRCETDRVILSTTDWEWVLLQDDTTGELALEDTTQAMPAPASET
jgi:hypothetical protein